MILIASLSGFAVLTSVEMRQHVHTHSHTCRGSHSRSPPLLLSVERGSWWLIMVEIYRILHRVEINLERMEIYHVLFWHSLCGAAPVIYAQSIMQNMPANTHRNTHRERHSTHGATKKGTHTYVTLQLLGSFHFLAMVCMKCTSSLKVWNWKSTPC